MQDQHTGVLGLQPVSVIAQQRLDSVGVAKLAADECKSAPNTLEVRPCHLCERDFERLACGIVSDASSAQESPAQRGHAAFAV